MATAKSVTPSFLAVNNNEKKIHPISFIWETDLLPIITADLSEITRTSLFKKLLEKVVKVAGEKLGVDIESISGKRGISSLSYEEIREELNKEIPFEAYSVNKNSRSANINNTNEKFLLEEIEINVEEEIESDPTFTTYLIDELSEKELTLIDNDKLINIPLPGSRGILSLAKVIKSTVTIIFKIIKRHVIKRDHGFYPTIVEEILREILVADFGSWTWGLMKQKAELMWLADSPGTIGQDRHLGQYFLQKLKKLSVEKQNLTIDLVGHSAGSIAICYFVRECIKLEINIQIRQIFFMAPACRIDLFHDTIIANKEKIGHFRMFTMSDQYESRDSCIPGIYTRSLLYMISGILEEKEYDAYILGLQRFHLDTAPYDQDPILDDVINYFNESENRIVYALTVPEAAEGLRCIAVKHGGFANDENLAIRSICYSLNLL